MHMSRGQRLASLGLGLLVAWTSTCLLANQGRIRSLVLLVCSTIMTSIVSRLLDFNSPTCLLNPMSGRMQAPVFSFLILGVYLLVRLVHGVYTFNSYPSAIPELHLEVEEARRDLARKGVR
ncbi:hypothetical protein Agub_g12698 [Astrephomene gubernaculifera]|uniref:Dolichol-phosphate mannosyltransferase subunit 3 n=1 Tax=Astrephomene gubernaculifera TaxID=47775 RepID=A0AAD3HS52_9CHLO|nr:hypothetical protein Agub_g12698 [Astrephomene gubernaculifera]